MNKLLQGLGLLAVASVPVFGVVSCGSTKIQDQKSNSTVKGTVIKKEKNEEKHKDFISRVPKLRPEFQNEIKVDIPNGLVTPLKSVALPESYLIVDSNMHMPKLVSHTQLTYQEKENVKQTQVQYAKVPVNIEKPPLIVTKEESLDTRTTVEESPKDEATGEESLEPFSIFIKQGGEPTNT